MATYVAAASNQAAGVASLPVTAPAARAVGDLLIAGVSCRGDRTVNTPAGWLPALSVANGTSVLLALFRRIADGTATDSPTFPLVGGTSPAAAGMVVLRGIDTVISFEVAATGGLTSPSILNATITNGFPLYVCVWRAASATRTATAPTGYTERCDVSNTSGTIRCGIAMSTRNVASQPGTIPSVTGTLSGSTTAQIAAALVVRDEQAAAIDGASSTLVGNDPGMDWALNRAWLANKSLHFAEPWNSDRVADWLLTLGQHPTHNAIMRTVWG